MGGVVEDGVHAGDGAQIIAQAAGSTQDAREVVRVRKNARRVPGIDQGYALADRGGAQRGRLATVRWYRRCTSSPNAGSTSHPHAADAA